MRNLNLIPLTVAGAVTSSGNGDEVDVSLYSGEARLFLSASATNGAGKKYDCKIQDSADNDSWSDTGIAFTQVDNSKGLYQVIPVNVDRFKRYIRVVDTVTGDTVSVTRFVGLLAKRDFS